MAMDAIRDEIPDAVFVQSESCEYAHPAHPSAVIITEFENERRFLPLDLIYGHDLSPLMYQYLRIHGMETDEYDFLLEHANTTNCILGTDYYVTNEHLIQPDGSSGPAGDVLGYYVLARQYYDRYRIPMMHTETNRREEQDSVGWLRKQWQAMLRLRWDGVPLMGFTWFSLTDQKDWNTALRNDHHHVDPVGLYDLNRKLRPVGKLYRQLIREWEVSLSSDYLEDAPVFRPRLAA